MSAIVEEASDADQVLYALLAGSGLRIGEALVLRSGTFPRTAELLRSSSLVGDAFFKNRKLGMHSKEQALRTLRTLRVL